MGHSHGTKWTEKLVKQEIEKCIGGLGLERMPTRSEIEHFYGDAALTGKIGKTIGFYGWAKKLGLDIKKSETTTGKVFEFKAKEALEEKGYKVDKMVQNAHFDLLVNDCVKIDVKSSTKYYNKLSEVNTFGINKKYATCDLYMLYALDFDGGVERIYVVPSYKVRCKTTMSIGKTSKYDDWLDRYDLITAYADYLKNIS